MIERYQHAEIKNIWNEASRFNYLWKVEAAVLKVLSQKKIIPLSEEELNSLCKKTNINLSRIHKIEQTTHHECDPLSRYAHVC